MSGTGKRGNDNSQLVIRAWRESDLAAIARLYYETVHRVNARDYNQEQLNVWAPKPWPATFWRDRFQNYGVLVAELSGIVVGFAEFDFADGHVDCFYVHHAWQHRGIGRALMQVIEHDVKQLGGTRLYADVSLTARPFFEAMGFVVKEARDVKYRGAYFHQFRMHRSLID